MYNKFEQNKAFSIVKKALNYLKPKYLAVCILLSLTFATVQSVYSAVGIRETINFQGKLVNSAGLNVADGSYSVVFSLYTVSSGGTNIWQETQNVSTVDGLFRVELGSVSSLSSVNFNDDSLYLGIKVGADAEMTPRVRYTATPYAFQAKNVSWSGLQSPNANTSLSMAAYTTSLLYSGTSGSNDLFVLSSSANSTGTGRLMSLRTATDSEISPFHVSAKGIEALFVSNLGRVGIGTTSPQKNLDIQGNARTSLSFVVGEETESGIQSLYFQRGGGSFGEASISGGVYFIPGDGWYQGSGNGGTSIQFSPGGLNFLTAQPGTPGDPATLTQRMVIKQSGNVGIGTDNPSARLQVAGAITASGIISGTGSGLTNLNASNITSGTIPTASVVGAYGNITGVGTLTSLNVSGSITQEGSLSSITGTTFRSSLGSLGTPSYSFTGDVNTGIFSPGADILGFVTSGTERMRITSTGTVGIGTASPVSKLSVTDETTIANRGITISQNTTDAAAALFNFRKSRGTAVSPTTVSNGDYTAAISTQNYDGSNYLFNGALGYRVNGTVTTNNVPSQWFFAASATTDNDPFANNTVRMVINSNGNVGIGTTNPSEQLEVSQSILIKGGLASGIKIDGSLIQRQTAGNALRFGVADAEVMRIQNGNVGIGTVSPSYKTEVAGANTGFWNGSTFTSTPMAMAISNTQPGGYDPVLMLQQTDSGGTIKNAGGIGLVGASNWAAGNNANQISNMYFLVRNNSGTISERMRITHDGNVGIGTASPGKTLHVAGSAKIGSGTSDAGGLLTINGGSNNQVNITHGNSNTWGLLLGYGDGTLTTDYHGNNHAAIVNVQNAPLHLGTFNNVRMTILGNGNVGIGTTSPGNLLTIAGSLTKNLTTGLGWGLMVEDTQTQALGVGGGIVFRGYKVSQTASANFGAIAGIKENNTSANELGSLLFYVNQGGAGNLVEVARISSSGNVGIGTTSPGSKFTVTNDIATGYIDTNTLTSGQWARISNPNTTSGVAATLLFEATGSGGGNGLGTISGVNTGSGSLALTFGTRDNMSNVIERVRIAANGNVGIGTTSPGGKLEVFNNVNDSHFMHINNPNASAQASSSIAFSAGSTIGEVVVTNQNYNYSINYGTEANTLQLINRGAGPLIFKTAGYLANAERMRITSNGNVGIGTTSPGTIFNVGGTTNKSISVDSSSNRAYYGAYNDAAVLGVNRDPATGSFFSTSKAASYIAMSGGASNGYIDFFATNVNNSNPPVIMRVAGNGNVGIGTVSPSSQLDIFGTTAGLQLSYDANDYGRFTVASDGALTLSGVSGGGALTNIARYSTSQINMDVPTSFNSAGDVSMAYDLYLSNQTASAIKSDGPLTIQSGEAFENLNLTLKASGQGNLIVQSKNIWADGTNVGIGTTNPGARLQVAGPATGSGITLNVGGGGDTVLASGGSLFFDGNYSYASGNYIRPIAANTQTFVTSGTERMRITSNGNVGIGTANPTLAKLDVNQSSGISPGSAIKFGAQGFLVSPSTIISHNGYWTGSAWANVSNATSAYLDLTGDITLRTAVATAGAPNWETRLTILNSNGNVGIGTASPQNNLDVRGSVNNFSASLARDINLNEWTGLHFGYSEAANNSYRKSAIVFERKDGSARGSIHILNDSVADAGSANLADSKLTIDLNGNVGIGTTTPSQALHVTGRIRMDTWTADGDAVAYRDAATNSIALITSDIRLKKDIIPIRSGLEVINQIGAYMYHELDENITDKYRLGVMAQELMPLMPELVYSFSRTGTSETFYSVHYDKLAVLLLKGIQEQQLQIEAQSSALQALDPKILDLENTLAQIELERATAVSQEEGGTAFENLYSIVEDTVSRVVSLENSVAEILSRIDSLMVPQISASDSARIEDLSQRMSFVEAMFMGELSTGLNSTASAQLAMSISENEIIFDRKVVAEGDLSVLGETNLGDVGVTGNITNNMLVINGFDESLATPGASLNTLAGALNIQSSGLNSINFVDGSFKMDTDGNFIIHKGNLEVSMGSVKGNDGIRGINVSVGQSQVEMRVNFKAKNDTENYAVGISPSWFTNFLVSGKDENGFTVKFSTPAPQGAKFDWIVIE